MTSQADIVQTAAQLLYCNSVSITLFMSSLLSDTFHQNPLTQELIMNPKHILHLFLLNHNTRKATEEWIFEVTTDLYQKQMEELARQGLGYHFLAKDVSTEQVQDWNIEHLGKGITKRHLGGIPLGDDADHNGRIMTVSVTIFNLFNVTHE
jgi:hypothetical protein